MAEADRNLLFGILALKLDLIAADQFMAGVQAWSADKSIPLPEHLKRLGHLSHADLLLLSPLVEEYFRQGGHGTEKSLARIASGTLVQQMLSIVAARDADVADSLSQWTTPTADPMATEIPTNAIEILETFVPGNLSGTLNVFDVESRAQSAGEPRFRIVRPHAEGGLGRVYVARDTELGRDVALKEIKPQYADELQSRGRFVLEAEITGGLEHPGIVPVYGLGAYADGRPFYAMRFIQGDSLKEAIERYHHPQAENQTSDQASRNLQMRELLGRFIDVCQAVAYAHSRGVLHRDLKPGNIMLGKYGETLVVDWGLAKACGRDVPGGNVQSPLTPPSQSGSGVLQVVGSGSGIDPTMAGAAMGTPQYMSPEQAAGKIDELGPVTDVYSLGGTLYHILTGQPPFAHWTRETDLLTRLREIQQGKFRPPSEIDPRVPPPLQAICLKGMAVKPEDRYQSLLDMAADVEHWLADEPVSASPDPVSVRVARWSRKHRTLVVSGAATVLVASIALIGLTVVILRDNHALQQANTRERTAAELAVAQRNEADKQRKLAVASEAEAQRQSKIARENAATARSQSELALQTLNGIVFDLNHSLEAFPSGGEVRRQMLRTALTKLDKIATAFVGGATVDFTTAVALTDLGTIVQRFGTGTVADNSGLDALRSQLVTAAEDRDALKLAAKLFGEAHRIREKLAAANPQDREAQRGLANSWLRLGDVQLQTGDLDTATKSYAEALRMMEALAGSAPQSLTVQRDLAVALTRMATADLQRGMLESARKGYLRCLEVSRKLVAQSGTRQAQDDLAISLNNLADLLMQTGDLDGAWQAYNEGMQIRSELVGENPSDAEVREDLAFSWHKLGDFLVQAGDAERARSAFVKSLSIRQQLANETPADQEAARSLSTTLVALGDVQRTLGQHDAAAKSYEQSLRIDRQLAAVAPTDAGRQRDLAITLDRMGDIALAAGDGKKARGFVQESLELRQKQLQQTPGDAMAQRDLSVCLDRLGDLELREGQLDNAREAYQRSLEIRQALASAAPEDMQAQRDLCVSLNRMGDLQLRDNNTETARATYEQALGLAQKLAGKSPSDARAQRDLSVVYEKFGDLYLREALAQPPQEPSQKRAAASSAFDACLRIRAKLAAAAPADASAQRDLMVATYKQGLVCTAGSNYRSAKVYFEAARDVLRKFNERSGMSAFAGELKQLDTEITACETAIPVTESLEATLKLPPETLPQWLAVRFKAQRDDAEMQPVTWLPHLEEAAKAAQALRERAGSDTNLLYVTARGYSALIGDLNRKKQAEVREGVEKIAHSAEVTAALTRWQTACVECLKAAVDAGWKDVERFAKDNEFDVVRELPEVKMLLEEAGGN